jgi:hypothetical protein
MLQYRVEKKEQVLIRSAELQVTVTCDKTFELAVGRSSDRIQIK